MSNQLPAVTLLEQTAVATTGAAVPVVIAAAGDQASWRYIEFFTANIRNPHTRRAYERACARCEDRKGWLFRTGKGWKAGILSDQPLSQDDAWRMIRRRAKAAGINAPIGCHTFRATGITTYLECGGTLEHAQAMAAHENTRPTKLYDAH